MSIYIQQPDKLQKLTGEKLTRSKIIAALGYTPSTFSGDYNDLTNKPIMEDESNSSSLYVQDSSGNIIALIDKKGLTTTDLNAGGTLFSSFVEATEQAINNLDSIKANKSDVSESIAAVEDRIDNITYDDIKGNPNLSDDGDYLEITDSNGNVLARFDSNGFTAASVVTQQLTINGTDVTGAITGIEATLNDYDGRITTNKNDIAENKTNIEANKSSIEALEEIVSPSGLQFNSSEFSIQDTSGNAILKVDESGLTTTNITSATTDNLQNQITTLVNDIEDVDQKADDINTDLSNHISDTVKHITAAERSAWNAKATTSYVDTKVAGIVDTAPETLNTLNELAAALGDDPNFATTVANEIGTKANASDLEALGGRVETAEGEIDALQELIDEEGLTFNNSEFVIEDSSGNTLAKFDASGLTVASIVSPTIDAINSTLDSYNNRIEDVETNSHTHTNKSVLDATTASYTTAEKTKLGGIAANAQVNVIETIATDNAKVTITSSDKTRTITGIAAQSDLTALGNTVKGKANQSDLEALGSRVEDTEEEIDALQGVIDENGLKFTNDEFVIEDSQGNTLAKFDASGLTVSAIVSPTITDVDNKAQGAADKVDELENELTNYVKKETGKGLSQNDLTNDLKQSYDTAVSKLSGISDNANKVEASTTNGNIKIDGVEKTVYTLPSDVVVDADLNDLNSKKHEHTNKAVLDKIDTEFTSTLKTSYDAAVSKLNGIQDGATKVEASTNGKIKINGTDTTVYTLPSDVLLESDLNGYVTEDDLQNYAQYSNDLYANNATAPIAVAAANGVGPSDVKLSDLAKTNDLIGLLSSSDIVDNLTTDNSLKVLSAKQGKILDEKIKNIGDIASGAGNGDMLKSVFATQAAASGKVDHAIYSDTANIADNANKLNGQEASYYATASNVTAHTTNTSNPHGVTAAQVGAYTKDEIDNALTLKVNTSALNDYAKVADLDSYVKSTDYQGAIDGINNELSGKATFSELQNYVLNSALNDYKTLVGNTYATQGAVENVVSYFDETIADYYTATEVDTLLENIEIDVDSTLSSTSTNPVQNKVINAALQNYAQWADGDIYENTERPMVAVAAAGGVGTSTLCIYDVVQTSNLNNYATKDYVTEVLQGATGGTDASSVLAALNAHKTNTSNPHGVTASQVGTYTTSEIDNKLSEKATTSTTDALSNRLTSVEGGLEQTSALVNSKADKTDLEGFASIQDVIELPADTNSNVIYRKPIPNLYMNVGGQILTIEQVAAQDAQQLVILNNILVDELPTHPKQLVEVVNESGIEYHVLYFYIYNDNVYGYFGDTWLNNEALFVLNGYEGVTYGGVINALDTSQMSEGVVYLNYQDQYVNKTNNGVFEFEQAGTTKYVRKNSILLLLLYQLASGGTTVDTTFSYSDIDSAFGNEFNELYDAIGQGASVVRLELAGLGISCVFNTSCMDDLYGISTVIQLTSGSPLAAQVLIDKSAQNIYFWIYPLQPALHSTNNLETIDGVKLATENFVDNKVTNYYTKAQIDNTLSGYATEGYVDNELNNYAPFQYVDDELSNALLDYYTKTQVDNMISSSGGGSFDPSVLNNYLSLSGGEMTGNLFFNSVAYIGHDVNEDIFRIDTRSYGGMIIESSESTIDIRSGEEINLESSTGINVTANDEISVASGGSMELQSASDCDLSISNYNCTINLSADGGIQLDENMSTIAYKDELGDNVAMQLDESGLIVSSITTNKIYSPELEEIKQDINSLSLRSMGWRYVGEGNFNGVANWTINTTENYQHKMALISLYDTSMDMNIGTVTTPLNATTYCMHVFNPEVDVFGMMVVGIHIANNSLSINIVHSSEEIGIDWFSDVVAKVYIMNII